MSSRAAAAAAHRSKTQSTVKPVSETSTKTDPQPAHKPLKRFAFIAVIIRLHHVVGGVA